MAVKTIGNYVPNFHAAQGVLWMDTAEITYSEAAALDSFFTAATCGQIVACKNINITPPKGEVEKVDLLGTEVTADGAGVPITGTFQNAIFDEKSWSEATMTCTLVLTGNHTDIPDFLQIACGAGLAISSTFRRYSFGDSTAGQIRDAAGAVILNCYNGVEEVNVLFNKPYANVGDIKPTSMEGHFEIDFEVKCLAKNFIIEEDET